MRTTRNLADTTSPEFFEERYRLQPDPWNFAESAYEQGRFERIVAALAGRRYRHGLEPGCSIGTLTIRLATFCDQLTALDVSPTAIRYARERCADAPHVNFSVAPLDEQTWVEGSDLVILSEIGYYFEATRWQHLAALLVGRMKAGTTVLASHWLGHSDEHVQTGDQVHQILRAVPQLSLKYEEYPEGFRLDRFLRL